MHRARPAAPLNLEPRRRASQPVGAQALERQRRGGRHGRSSDLEIDVKDKSVLELGAGAALPSLLAGICGARCVVATDYAIDTDTHLVDNIRENLLRYTQKEGEAEERKESTWAGVAPGIMHAEGHVWGQEVQQLLKHASAASAEGSQACEEAEEIVAPCPGFDIVFMCDLVFNRSEHEKLLLTLARTLDKVRQGAPPACFPRPFQLSTPFLAFHALSSFPRPFQLSTFSTLTAASPHRTECAT
eukprot:scaffold470_cov257-Pinguiococcus_pyrenoidosus.AAC.2